MTKREMASALERANRRRTNDNYLLRDLPSRRYEEHRLPGEFRDFFREEVLPLLSLSGYKQSEQSKIARYCIHNLIGAGRGACVSDTRNNALPGVRLRVRMWDAILKADLATACVGSEESGKVTRYRATPKLLTLRKEWRLTLMDNLSLARNTQLLEPTHFALVSLHTGKFDPSTGDLLPDVEQRKPTSIREHVAKRAQLGPDGNPDPRAIENGMAYFRDIEDRIERINRVNTSHAWQEFRRDPETGREYVYGVNTCLRQIHAGKFFRAARLYSCGILSGQRLNREARQTIKIDGELSAELDYSCLHLRMLYHRKRLDPPGDLYRPEVILPTYYGLPNVSESKLEVVRDFIKRATNICWNVSKRSAANSSVGKLLGTHEESSFIWKVMRNVEGCGPTDIVDRIVQAHPDLAGDFFTGVGLELMTLDGQIMLGILSDFVANAGKPALGIHDALLCKASDVNLAKETMVNVYERFVRFSPQIKRVF